MALFVGLPLLLWFYIDCIGSMLAYEHPVNKSAHALARTPSRELDSIVRAVKRTVDRARGIMKVSLNHTNTSCAATCSLIVSCHVRSVS